MIKRISLLKFNHTNNIIFRKMHFSKNSNVSFILYEVLTSLTQARASKFSNIENIYRNIEMLNKSLLQNTEYVSNDIKSISKIIFCLKNAIYQQKDNEKFHILYPNLEELLEKFEFIKLNDLEISNNLLSANNSYIVLRDAITDGKHIIATEEKNGVINYVILTTKERFFISDGYGGNYGYIPNTPVFYLNKYQYISSIAKRVTCNEYSKKEIIHNKLAEYPIFMLEKFNNKTNGLVASMNIKHSFEDKKVLESANRIMTHQLNLDPFLEARKIILNNKPHIKEGSFYFYEELNNLVNILTS